MCENWEGDNNQNRGEEKRKENVTFMELNEG